jgi:hypothetical protein
MRVVSESEEDDNGDGRTEMSGDDVGVTGSDNRGMKGELLCA